MSEIDLDSSEENSNVGCMILILAYCRVLENKTTPSI
jgi:hypothetical protein